MSKRSWSRLSILGFVMLVLVAIQLVMDAWQAWQRGDHGRALFAFSIIPLGLACWGLSHLLAGRKRREIARNLTDDERAELEQMSARFGLKMGFLFAVPISTAAAVAHSYYGPIGCGIVFIVGMAAGMPFAYRLAKPMREFLWNTQYARAHFGISGNESAAV